MSAETIARWNAIPLARPGSESDASRAMKRSRPEDDDDSEDNVSLLSRSPSPQPPADAMDIDKYDEYVAKPARETVTVDTRIKSSNKGFAMLASMGWVEGQPLGLSGDGRVDPVPFYVKNDLTGLGKTNQDVRMIETTVAQRRELDSERQTKETEEQRRAREDSVAKRVAVQSEIVNTLKAFYCELCDKQFQNVAQYDEHTNSYAHHHKARFRDMQMAARASRNTQEEMDKRKEKERKREEKELRKVAKAAGIKITKPTVPLITPASTPGTAATPSGAKGEPMSTGLKKTGWASVGSSSRPTSVGPPSGPSTSGSASNSSGWASVRPASSGSSQSQEPRSSESRGGWAPVTAPPDPRYTTSSNPPNTAPRQAFGSAPAFRTGGWTSLDTSSGERALPPPSVPPPLSHPPFSTPHVSSPAETAGDWSSDTGSGAAVQPSQSGWQTVSSQASAERPSIPNPVDVDGTPVPAARPAPLSRPQPPPPPRQEASRSGWQHFRAAGPGRRR
ncbi:uncharacterized protein B0H18DRAFT_1113319 [Fomitopsis serialis]|uniref:uncharacterized protein n=1 Tax=Fomitopsis serialis TaxID=139415 RepID=UPI0020075029|nr:uncharacterized protein B0H18DRAFT_1113319 [Neoantrodia serialis]KAH9937492.1 hypothetical protein B0H18DRAFT_1113319 [Neoantrodia serialis]